MDGAGVSGTGAERRETEQHPASYTRQKQHPPIHRAPTFARRARLPCGRAGRFAFGASCAPSWPTG